MKRLPFLLMLLVVPLCAPKIVHAVSLSVDSFPSEIHSNEFELHFTVSGAKPATNYFRVLVYKESSKTYVVRTWNGNTWYDGSDGKQYLPVNVTGKTSETLKAQIPDTVENGDYLLSVKRYTQSGNAANDTVTPVQIHIDISRDTHTPAPTAAPTKQPTPSSTPTPEEVIREEVVSTEPPTEVPVVLAMSDTSPDPTPLPTPEVTIEDSPPTSPLLVVGIVFCLTGIAVASYGGFLWWREKKLI